MPLLLLLLLSSPDAVFMQRTVTVDLSMTDTGYVETTSELIVPLTARGVRRYGTMTSSYRNGWESLQVRAAVRHWRSGRGADSADIREEPHSSLLAGGRLESSLREVHISFPGLEVGDTIRVEITRTIRNLPLGDLYSYTYYAASRDSVHRGAFRVIKPRDLELLQSVSGEFATSVSSDGPRELLVWEAGPHRPLPFLPFSPDPARLSPRVTVASHTPRQVSAVLYSRRGTPVTVPADDDPMELRNWVATEIEYLGADWGDYPGYTPRSPEETLADRAGACRDKALLLARLLDEAGHDPVLVLTSLSGYMGSLPGSRSFDHMLVALAGAGGDTIFLDPVNQMTADGYTYSLRGREYLPLTPEGSPLRRFPDRGEGDTLRIRITGVLDPGAGILEGEMTAVFSGSAEELFRYMLSSVPGHSVHLLLQRLFGALPPSTLTIEGDPSSPHSTLRITGEGRWRLMSVSREGAITLVLPGLADTDLVGSRASAFLMPGFREHLFVETPYTAVLELRVGRLPAGEPVLPEPVEMNGYGLEVSIRGDTLALDELLSLVPAYPGPEETGDIRDACLASISAVHRNVTFR